ncbi:hypothetical protein lerEdw1_009540 [Lerista edwardsae]|nr:hypothetical protein lerEdw1_009540 [Lerista edwardsae]
MNSSAWLGAYRMGTAGEETLAGGYRGSVSLSKGRQELKFFRLSHVFSSFLSGEESQTTTPAAKTRANYCFPNCVMGYIAHLLLDFRKRTSVPFSGSFQSEDELAMMDEILGPGAQIPVRTSIPSCSNGPMAKTTTLGMSGKLGVRVRVLGAVPTDTDLLTSMMQKIVSLEQKVKSQASAIQQKEKTIKELEEQLHILQEGKEESSETSRAEELEVICLRLQRQIWEMERFLNDYGLIWVGEGTDSATELELLTEESSQPSSGVWKPGDSILPASSLNFDLIFENLKDLNVLAGEGMSQIEHIAGGARLKQLDSIPLTFYQNGIVMFNGPFRSYEEPSTQQCLRDIMDGYFPSELQRRYPEGIAFKVTDKRDVFFRERQLPQSFPGLGQVTGHSKPRGARETREIPGPKFTMEQFLNKLPKSLIRDGHVIDIRGEIREALQGSGQTQAHEVILVEPASQPAAEKRHETIKERQGEAPDRSRTTLRIRSENGEKTYVVRMPVTETIGALRQHLDRVRGEVQPYEIHGIFPHQVYENNSLTLEECGLVPNTYLLLQKKPRATKSQGVQL